MFESMTTFRNTTTQQQRPKPTGQQPLPSRQHNMQQNTDKPNNKNDYQNNRDDNNINTHDQPIQNDQKQTRKIPPNQRFHFSITVGDEIITF